MIDIEEYFETEERLRMLNSEIQGVRSGKVERDVYELAREGYYNFWKFRNLIETVENAEHILDEVYHLPEDESRPIEIYRPAIWSLIEWAEYIENWSDIACRREDGFAKCEEIPTRKFYELQERIRLDGIQCGFLSPDEERASILKVVDSFTNCYHTLGFKLAEIVSVEEELEETEGRCTIVSLPEDEETKELAIKACKTYIKSVGYNEYHYSGMDKGCQKGYIFSDKLQFNLGCAEGHAAEIDLEDREFRYYDHDFIRAYAIVDALNRVGFNCTPGLYITCSLPEGDFEHYVLMLADFLAYIPSLDIHANDVLLGYTGVDEDCYSECVDESTGEGTYCYDICEDDCKADAEEEQCRNCVYGCAHEVCVEDCERTIDDLSDVAKGCLSDALSGVLEGYTTSYDDVLYDFESCVRASI